MPSHLRDTTLTADIRLRCNILRGGQLRHFATQQMASSITVSASNCIDLEIGILEQMGLQLNKEGRHSAQGREKMQIEYQPNRMTLGGALGRNGRRDIGKLCQSRYPYCDLRRAGNADPKH